jgi:disulfide oxidoreductase YuzD
VDVKFGNENSFRAAFLKTNEKNKKTALLLLIAKILQESVRPLACNKDEQIDEGAMRHNLNILGYHPSSC